MERNIHLTVAYDGTKYHGFQRQANAFTVQELLEERLAALFGHPLKIAGAARTDAGVHACGQSVSFITTGTIPVERIPPAARSVLPGDVVVTAARLAPSDFHARFCAKSKVYVYRLFASEVQDPFLRQYVWHLTAKPDVTAMDSAARLVEGEHDFSAFRAAGGAAKSPVRTIYRAVCRQEGQLIEFEFWGNGFLYHMVRNLVGTLVDVGQGRLTAYDFAAILAGCDRKLAGNTAPPQGLYLKKVVY